MWRRLGEVCDALATAGEAATLRLWQRLTRDDVLAQGCHSALYAGARGIPTLRRCLEILADESLIDRLNPHLAEIRRWQYDETGYLVREARDEIEGAILAIFARRCAAGEPLGSHLLSWASHCCTHRRPGTGDVAPIRADRPVAWLEACIPLIVAANVRLRPDRHRHAGHVRMALEPALLHLQRHELGEFLRGAIPVHVSALARLLVATPLADASDLPEALTGAGECGLAPQGGHLTPYEDFSVLPALVASEDVRVRFVALLIVGEILADCAACARLPPHDSSYEYRRVPPDLADALNAARSDVHPLVAALACCGAGQIGRPAVSLADVAALLVAPSPVVRVAAVTALAFMDGGCAYRDELAPLLADPAASVRLAAAEAVRQMGRAAASPAVLTCLLSALDDGDRYVQREAIEATTSLGPAMTEAIVARLVALAASDNELIRRDAVEALGAAGARGRRPEVFAALAARFDDRDSCIREEALRAYAVLEGPADAAVLTRVTAMSDQERIQSCRQAAFDLLAVLRAGDASRIASDKCLVNAGDPLTEKGRRNDSDDLMELSLDQIYKIRDKDAAI